MARKIEMWKAIDGTTHETRRDAKARDRRFGLEQRLSELAEERAWTVHDGEAIVKDMLECSEALLEMFHAASEVHRITVVKLPRSLAIYAGAKKVYEGPETPESMRIIKALCEPEDTMVIPEDPRQPLSDDLATVREMYPCTK